MRRKNVAFALLLLLFLLLSGSALYLTSVLTGIQRDGGRIPPSEDASAKARSSSSSRRAGDKPSWLSDRALEQLQAWVTPSSVTSQGRDDSEFTLRLKQDESGKKNYRKRSLEELLSQEYIKHELLVRFRDGSSEETVERVLRKLPTTEVRKILVDPKTVSPSSQLYHLKLKQSCSVKQALQLVRDEPTISYTEPNYIVYAALTPNDPYYSSSGSWGQGYEDLWGQWAMNCGNAWNESTGSSVIVAVVDSGVDMNHEDLSNNIWENTHEVASNGIDDDGNGYVDDIYGWDFANDDNTPVDDHGHGSHVAGTIAATGNNSVGVVGVAFESQIMVLRGLGGDGSGSVASLASCLYYAANNGADVINNSWGGRGFSQTIEDALEYAHGRNCVIVAAAGNDSANAGDYFPANSSYCITVSAYGPDGYPAYFTNYGSKIDVAAPGMDILSCKGAGTNMGIPEGSYYTRAQGTSMAAPHVSGLAALIISKSHTLDNEEVRQIIRSNATDAGDPGFDHYYGYGFVDAAQSVGASPMAVVNIFWPFNNQEVSGVISILGTVKSETLINYTLDYGEGTAPSSWNTISTSVESLDYGVLGIMDTNPLQNTYYTLRLTATDANGTVEDRVTVKVRNQTVTPSVNVLPSSVTLNVGNTQQFTATTTGAEDLNYIWDSSNPTVASVDGNGLVTALSAGNANIMATGTSTGLSDSASVTVVEPCVNVSPKSLSLGVSEQGTLSAWTTNGSDSGYVWMSSDTSIATVSSSGGVTGIAPGNCRIRATGNDTGLWDECELTVGSWILVSSAEYDKLLTSPDGNFIFVLPRGLGNVFVYDAETQSLVDELNCGTTVSDACCSQDGSMLYVASCQDKVIYKFNLPSLTNAGTITLADKPYDIIIGRPDRLYVLYDDIYPSAIDISTGTEVAVFPDLIHGDERNSDLAITPDGNILFAGVRKYDVSTDTITRIEHNYSHGGPRLRISPDGARLIVGKDSSPWNVIDIVDIAAMEVVANAPHPRLCSGLEAEGLIFGVSKSTGAIETIDLQRYIVRDSFYPYDNIHDIAVSGDGTYLFVLYGYPGDPSYLQRFEIPANSVWVSPREIEITEGQTIILEATTRLQTDSTYTWNTSDAGIVTVDSSGAITAVSPGMATITATGLTSGETGSAVVTVKENTGLARYKFASQNNKYNHDGAADPVRDKVYVTDPCTNSLFAFSSVDGNMLNRLYVGANPWAVAVTPDGSKAVVTLCEQERVAVVDLENFTVSGYFRTERRQASRVICTNEIAAVSNGAFCAVDLSTGETVKYASGGSELLLSKSRKRCYAAGGGATVVYDLNSWPVQEVFTRRHESAGHARAISPDESMLLYENCWLDADNLLYVMPVYQSFYRPVISSDSTALYAFQSQYIYQASYPELGITGRLEIGGSTGCNMVLSRDNELLFCLDYGNPNGPDIYVIPVPLTSCYGSIRGRVFDDLNGNPICGARIELVNSDRIYHTDTSGGFLIDASKGFGFCGFLRPGTYSVKIWRPRYDEVEVQNVVVTAGETTVIPDIHLPHEDNVIPVSLGARETRDRIVASPSGSTFYVLTDEYYLDTQVPERLVGIDATNGQIVLDMPFPKEVWDMAISRDGNYMYITGGGEGNVITEVNLLTSTVNYTTVISDTYSPGQLVYGRDNKLYVFMSAGTHDKAIGLFDTAAKAVIAQVGCKEGEIIADSAGERLYLYNDYGIGEGVYVYDISGDNITLINSALMNYGASQFQWVEALGQLYVGSYTVDPLSLLPVDFVGQFPRHSRFSPEGSAIYSPDTHYNNWGSESEHKQCYVIHQVAWPGLCITGTHWESKCQKETKGGYTANYAEVLDHCLEFSPALGRVAANSWTPQGRACTFLIPYPFSGKLSGILTGEVRDADTGAPLSASVKIVEPKLRDTSPNEDAQTTSRYGSYKFYSLEPGTYTILITAEGYADLVISDLTVIAGQQIVAPTANMVSLPDSDKHIQVTGSIFCILADSAGQRLYAGVWWGSVKCLRICDQNGVVLKDIYTPGVVEEMVEDPARNRVYAKVGNELWVLDCDTLEITGPVSLPAPVGHVAWSSRGRLYYSSGDGVIRIIDTGTLTVVGEITDTLANAYMAVSSDGTYLYASSWGVSDLRKYDVSTDSPSLVLQIDPATINNEDLRMIELSPDNSVLYSSRGYAIATSDFSVLGQFQLSYQWPEFAVSPDGNYVYYMAEPEEHWKPSRVYVYSTSTFELVGMHTIGSQDYALNDCAVSSDGSCLFVAAGNGIIYRVALESGKFPAWPVMLDGTPRHITVVQMDGSGCNELFFAIDRNLYVVDSNFNPLPGWPVELDYSLKATPAIGDIDNDGQCEIVVVTLDSSSNNVVRIFDLDGSERTAGWPQIVGGGLCLADIDGGGDLEVVALGTSSDIHAFKHTGAELSGWPAVLSGSINAVPAAGDVDSDGKAELFVSYNYSDVHGIDHNGTPLSGWPITSGSNKHSTQPIIADLDNDGTYEIVTRLGVFRPDGTKTISLDPFERTVVADFTGDGRKEIFWVWDYNSSGIYDYKKHMLPGWPFNDTSVPESPVAVDVDGDGTQEIIGHRMRLYSGWSSLRLCCYRHDATDLPSWPRTLLYSAAYQRFVIYDAGGDGVMDLLVILDNRVYKWNLGTAYSDDRVGWNCVGANPQRNSFIPSSFEAPSSQPPSLDFISDKSVDENQLLEFTLTATDPDSAELRYSVHGQNGYTLPEGFSLDPVTGQFSWQPGYTQSGVYNFFVFSVSDSKNIDEQVVTITVNDANAPPAFLPTATQTVKEGEYLQFTVLASDVDGQPLTYSCTNPTSGASFAPATRTFSWSPDFEQSGTYYVTFRAEDPLGAFDTTDVEVIVVNVNRTAFMDTIGTQFVYEGQLIEFTVFAEDPDGESLTYSASNLPPGATFVPATATFSWTPSIGATGVYMVTFTATDPWGDSDSEVVKIIVEQATLHVSTNFLPQGTEGKPYSAVLSAACGTTPYIWSLDAGSNLLPPGLTLGADGTISGTPESPDDYTFTVKVTDAIPNEAVKELSITVRAPQITINGVSEEILGPVVTTSTVNWECEIDAAYAIEIGGDGTPGSGAEIDSGLCSANVPVDTLITDSDIPDNAASDIYVIIDTGFHFYHASTQITDDHTAPSSIVTHPADGSVKGSVNTISGTAADSGGSSVTSVQICIFDGMNYFDTGSGLFDCVTAVWIPVTLDTTSWSFNSSAVPWVDYTDYTIQSAAIDAVGNIETPGAGITFTYNSQVPTVTVNTVSHTVIGPAQDSTINWVSDKNGDYYIEVGGTGQIGTGYLVASGACTGGVSVNSTITGEDLPDNVLSTIWVMVDNAGNVGNESCQIRDDETPPASSITQPANGSSLDLLTTVSGTGSDTGGSTVSMVEVSIYDGNDYYDPTGGDFTSASEVWISAAGTTSWTLSTAAVPWKYSKSYALQSRATDAVGNVETPGTGVTFTYTGDAPPYIPPKKSRGGCALSRESPSGAGYASILVGLILIGLLLVFRKYGHSRVRDM